jgi:hypothetical protein
MPNGFPQPFYIKNAPIPSEFGAFFCTNGVERPTKICF